MFGLLLVASLIPKIILWASLYSIIRHYYISRLFSLTFSYLISYLLMIFFMIVLSPFKMIERQGLIICYGITIIALYLWRRRFIPAVNSNLTASNQRQHAHRRLGIANIMPLLIVVVIFSLLTVRSLLYYDNTDDAMIQGLTKVGFIIQHRSLFVYYESAIINTFSNEWLGELNSVYYMAMTQQDIATSFANVEIWVVMVLFFSSSYSIFHPHRKKNWLVAVAISCSAVVIGIAMTIKTDLFAMALLPFAIACLYQYYEEEKSWNLFAAIVAVGAAAGAKIAILPAAGLLLAILVFHFFFRTRKKQFMPVLLGACFFMVSCFRYILNIWYYHNPFQRAINEKISASFTNMHNTTIGILREFNEVPEIWMTRTPWASSNWAVNKGLGWAGYPFLVIFIIAATWFIIKMFRTKTIISCTKVYYLALPVFAGLVFTMFSTPWYPWSFRYYAPYIFSAVIVSTAWLSARWSEASLTKSMIWFCQAIVYVVLILSCVLNGCYSFRYGQAIPATFEQIQTMTPIEKKLSFNSFVKASDFLAIPKFEEKLQNGGRALVAPNFMAPPYYQYFGDNACVIVDLAYDAKHLLEKVISVDINYDFLVVTFDPALGCEPEDALLTKPLESLGYEKHLINNVLLYIK